MKNLFIFLFLLFNFNLKASSINETKYLNRKPHSLAAPHVKLAVELVGRYNRDQLKFIKPYTKGHWLSAHKRSYGYAINNYYKILDKYYLVEHYGINADDKPLTNGVYRRAQEAIHEKIDRSQKSDDIWKVVALGIGLVSILK